MAKAEIELKIDTKEFKKQLKVIADSWETFMKAAKGMTEMAETQKKIFNELIKQIEVLELEEKIK